MIIERCSTCGREYELDVQRWRCTQCQDALDVTLPAFDPARIERTRYGVWRYAALLPVPPGAEPVTLGEGHTPLLEFQDVHLKCESLNPSGSFKDRGMSVLVTALAALGARELVEDSSGNAGAALAAYAARAGLPATIYVPLYAPPAKLVQIEAYGAQLVRIHGSRQGVANAAQAAVLERRACYASHVWQPINLAGQATVAYEVWEQLGGQAPQVVVMPVGHGTLLLGMYWGFCSLLASACIDQLPRLVGVQPEACAPLVRGYPNLPGAGGVTVANGARIARPVRGEQILAAVRASGGRLVAIPDEETLRARDKLARAGIYVEPTSALAMAALEHIQRAEGERVVVVLTGHGLKGTK